MNGPQRIGMFSVYRISTSLIIMCYCIFYVFCHHNRFITHIDAHLHHYHTHFKEQLVSQAKSTFPVP